METRIEEYTVGELAKAARISVRTLHHYDAIGLLKPAHVAANGYRLYRRAEAERLQEILFYRATGMDLAQIALVLDGGDDRLDRLQAHRAKLDADAKSLAEMIQTLDRSIAVIKGDPPMALEDLYKPFAPETQADYEAWLVQTYGPTMVDEIAKAKEHLANADMEDRIDQLRQIETGLVQAYQEGQARPDALLDAHRDWVSEMWGNACPPAAYGGLAELYRNHPDFLARYEALAPGFSRWLPDAMEAYVAGLT